MSFERVKLVVLGYGTGISYFYIFRALKLANICAISYFSVNVTYCPREKSRKIDFSQH